MSKPELSPESIHQLEKNGYLIWDDFLPPEELVDLLADFKRTHDDGLFKRAGIGKGWAAQLNDGIRLDETYWFEPLSLSVAQKVLWDRLEKIKNELNESLFLGLWDFEAHYSHYPIGGFYLKHLDRFSQDDTRTISMVLYFNTDWKPADGGELRIHHQDKISPAVDIAPIAGRLVCFMSEDTVHEVLKTQKERLSFAGWWKRRK